MSLDSDVLAKLRDRAHIPPPIDCILGGIHSGRKGTSGASSSQTSVRVEKLRALETKVDRVAATIEKVVGCVNDIWTWMKEARCVSFVP